MNPPVIKDKKPERTCVKFKPGYYNYRGYNIVRYGPRCWFIFNEDDSPAAETETLRAMRRVVDQWESKK